MSLVLLFVGAVLLRQAAPVLPVEGRQIEGLVESELETRTCDRSDDRERINEIRSDVPPQGRVTSEQVLACPMAFDGLSVTYVGEAIGELLPRDGGAWVLVNDDDYALDTGPLPTHRDFGGFSGGLRVWLPDELLDEIDGFGGPERRGTILELRGTVVRDDPDDAGGLTMRALSAEVVRESESIGAPFHAAQAVTASVLAVLAAGAWVLARRSNRRR